MLVEAGIQEAEIMSDESLAELWRNHNEHKNQTGELHTQVQLLKQEQGHHREQITQILATSAQRHGELLEKMAAQSEKTDTILEEMHENRGANKYKKWLMPVIITAIAAGVTASAIL